MNQMSEGRQKIKATQQIQSAGEIAVKTLPGSPIQLVILT
jgi:hypothetical protein